MTRHYHFQRRSRARLNLGLCVAVGLVSAAVVVLLGRWLNL